MKAAATVVCAVAIITGGTAVKAAWVLGLKPALCWVRGEH